MSQSGVAEGATIWTRDEPPAAAAAPPVEMFNPFYPPEITAELLANGMLLPQPVLVPLPNGRHRIIFPPLMPFHPALLPRQGHSGAPGEGPPQMRKLFIGGLNHETTDEDLRAYYSTWGTVVDAIVIRDPQTKHSRGFGFVTFSTIAQAEGAMADRPHLINGKTVDSKRAIPREQMFPLLLSQAPPSFDTEPSPGCKLTLSGLHWDYHTVDVLRLYFLRFGTLDQVEILGHPRGFGFVVFEEREAADACLAFNRGRHIINERRVDVRPCPILPAPMKTGAAARARPMPLVPTQRLSSMTLDDTGFDESESSGATTEDESKASETLSTNNEPFPQKNSE